MKKTIAPFSALYRPPLVVSVRSPATPTEPVVLRGLSAWTPESDPNYPGSDPSAHFSSATGEYTVALDGLYTVRVQLIPINGGAMIAQSSRRRDRVDYVLRLTLPPPDDVQSDYQDIGTVNLGQLVHLRAGTRIACLQMPGGTQGRDCLRLMIDLVQRKRKRYQKQMTRKEIKKRRKDKRKAACAMPHNPSSNSTPAVKHHKQMTPVDSTSTFQYPFVTDCTSSPYALTTNKVARSHALFPSYPSPTLGSAFSSQASSSVSPISSFLPSPAPGLPSTMIKTDNDSMFVNSQNGRLETIKNPSDDSVDISRLNVKEKEELVENEDAIDDDDDDDDSSSDDSDWEAGFESDSTADELSHPNRNVNQMSKRLKISPSPSSPFLTN